MNKDILRRIVQTVLLQIIQFTILFISAGTLKWKWAWIFIITGVVILIINMIVIPSEVIEERGRKKENVKKWDKILTSINILPMIGLYVLSGLDYRYGLTGDLPSAIHIFGISLYFLSVMLFTWSMVSNRFFSTMVRIQTEREHSVETEGPYKYVRHPGYVGFILMTLATPVALGTLYSLIMSGITAIILIIRTSLEDKTLRNELTGYVEYTKNVKYRLIPYVW
ncbi:methyltransferase family protein [candidate division KSB1 bacterium]